MSDTKPRVWWIDHGSFTQIVRPSREACEWSVAEPTKVIEYSAYESVKAERDELARKLDELRIAISSHHNVWGDQSLCMTECVALCRALKEIGEL